MSDAKSWTIPLQILTCQKNVTEYMPQNTLIDFPYNKIQAYIILQSLNIHFSVYTCSKWVCYIIHKRWTVQCDKSNEFHISCYETHRAWYQLIINKCPVNSNVSPCKENIGVNKSNVVQDIFLSRKEIHKCFPDVIHC